MSKGKKYSFKDNSEHEKQLSTWRDKFIANTMSTKPMSDEEKEICRIAVKGLYEAANLMPPPRERIVFVQSPFVLRFAGGFAAAIWYLRDNKKNSATRAATWAATWDATRDATEAATWDATEAATRDATRDATRAATRDATEAATWDATRDATEAATEDATWDATWAATASCNA